MSEDLALVFSVDTADAVAGVDAVNTALGKTQTAAASAQAGLKGLDAATLGLSGALKDLAPSGSAAFAAFEKLSNVTGIRGLSISIVQAQNAMDGFKKSVADAEASGVRMPPAIGNALKAMQGDITNATQKLGDLRKSQADLAATSAIAGSQLDKLRQSGTSLGGMFESMERTGTGLTKTVGQIGLGIGIAGAAFAGAEVAGKALAAGIDYLSKTFITYDKELRPITGNVNAVMKAHQALKGQFDEASKALKALGVTWHSAGEEVLKFSETLPLVTTAIDTQIKYGYSWRDVVSANTKELTAIRHALDLKGEGLDAVNPKIAKAVLMNEQWAKATEAAATKLEALRAKHDALDKSLDTTDSAILRQINLYDRLNEAMDKQIAAGKKFDDAQGQIDAGLDKITAALRQELVAAQSSTDAVGKTADAHHKAALALVEYADKNGISVEKLVLMLKAQENVAAQMDAAAKKGIPELNAELEKQNVTLGSVAARTQTFAEQQKAAADATREFTKATAEANAEFEKQAAAIQSRNAAIDAATASTNAWGAAINGTASGLIASTEQATAWGASLANMSKITGQATIDNAGLDKSLHDAASSALAATDAFGKVAGGLTEISTTADDAMAGLEGVAWEMRKATPVTISLTDAQKALIESLAKLSDAGGASSLWVGHLIAQLEKGQISFEDFQKQVNETLRGLTVFGSVMGNTAAELNAINTLLSNFKNNAGSGWPTTGTSNPYATAL